jgi:hypothetical protein
MSSSCRLTLELSGARLHARPLQLKLEGSAARSSALVDFFLLNIHFPRHHLFSIDLVGNLKEVC